MYTFYKEYINLKKRAKFHFYFFWKVILTSFLFQNMFLIKTVYDLFKKITRNFNYFQNNYEKIYFANNWKKLIKFGICDKILKAKEMK